MLLFSSRSETDLVDGQCEVLTVVEAVGEHLDVRGDECRFLGELAFQKVDSLVNRAVEQPAYDA